MSRSLRSRLVDDAEMILVGTLPALLAGAAAWWLTSDPLLRAQRVMGARAALGRLLRPPWDAEAWRGSEAARFARYRRAEMLAEEQDPGGAHVGADA